MRSAASLRRRGRAVLHRQGLRQGAELAARHAKLGGTDKSVHTIYVQALYLGNNFAAAAKAISADVEAKRTRARRPRKSSCSLWRTPTCSSAIRPATGKRWRSSSPTTPSAITAESRLRHCGPPRLLGASRPRVARLKIETGTVRTGNEYLEAAQLSLIDGFPAEAARIIDKAMPLASWAAAPTLRGTSASKDMAARSLAEDRKSLNASADAAEAKDAKTLFNEGFNLVLNGKAEQGLQMMENALRQGIAGRRPDHARLQLAYAYHLGGQDQKAVQIFRTVQGADAPLPLARAWAIRLAALREADGPKISGASGALPAFSLAPDGTRGSAADDLLDAGNKGTASLCSVDQPRSHPAPAKTRQGA